MASCLESTSNAYKIMLIVHCVCVCVCVHVCVCMCMSVLCVLECVHVKQLIKLLHSYIYTGVHT